MRLRIRYSKKGKVRFISHRDVARIWERALRRVGVSVAYSQGFSPRPKLSFGLALSTGHESEAEFLDLELLDEDGDWTVVRGEDLAARLTVALPVGLDVVAVAPVEKGDSLQQAVTSCTWAIEVDDVDREYMDAWVADVLSREEIVVER